MVQHDNKDLLISTDELNKVSTMRLAPITLNVPFPEWRFCYTLGTVSDSTMNIDFSVKRSTLLLLNISVQFKKIRRLLLLLCGLQPQISSN
jgi:hypothetical protein